MALPLRLNHGSDHSACCLHDHRKLMVTVVITVI